MDWYWQVNDYMKIRSLSDKIKTEVLPSFSYVNMTCLDFHETLEEKAASEQ